MSEQTKALATVTAVHGVSIFNDADRFAFAQRTCNALIQSEAIPKLYQKNLPNALVAFEYAQRMDISILEVMQNLDIIQGKPSFSAKYVAARVNTCGRFTELEYEFEDVGEREIEYTYTEWSGNSKQRKTAKIKVNDRRCTAYATNLRTGKVLRSETISIEMAVKEGWYTKEGSKWQTMPMLMLQYRAAKFFQNQYAPELMNGFPSTEELIDITPKTVDITHEEVPSNSSSKANINETIRKGGKKPVSGNVDNTEAQGNVEASPTNQIPHAEELM